MSDIEFFGTLIVFAVGIIALFLLVVKRHIIIKRMKLMAVQARANILVRLSKAPMMGVKTPDPWPTSRRDIR